MRRVVFGAGAERRLHAALARAAEHLELARRGQGRVGEQGGRHWVEGGQFGAFYDFECVYRLMPFSR